MAHLHSTRTATAAPLPDLLSLVDPSPETPIAGKVCVRTNHNRNLDRAHLLAGRAALQRELADVEADLVTACERAAARGASRGIHIDDRETWDKAMWHRYIAAAGRLEPGYGPRLRHLYQQVDRLDRLAALPLAA